MILFFAISAIMAWNAAEWIIFEHFRWEWTANDAFSNRGRSQSMGLTQHLRAKNDAEWDVSETKLEIIPQMSRAEELLWDWH